MPKADFQRHLREHYTMCSFARKCAAMAVECEAAGDSERAKKWTEEASRWLSEAMEIERKYKLRSPHEDSSD